MPVTALPPDAFLFALAAALAFAFLDLSQKWSARYAVSTPSAFLALRLGAGAILSPLLLLLPGALHGRHVLLAAFAALVVCNLLGNVLYLRSVYRADISTLGSLWPLKNAYLPLLALALPPHTVFPFWAYPLLLLATFGAVLIAWNGQKMEAGEQKSVALMVFATVPVFALSDYFFNLVVPGMGAPLATTLTAWALAALALPPLLLSPATRADIRQSLTDRQGRGIIGALLTGAFLVVGVVCIGEAFRRAVIPGGFVLVNVYAMTSGIVLLGVNAVRRGWLEARTPAVYAVRIAGAALLIAAATGLKLLGAGRY